MTIFKLIRLTWVRAPGLVLLVGLAAGCAQWGASGSDLSFMASVKRGRNASERQDFATSVDAYARSVSLAPTDKLRAMALVLQSAAEVEAGRPEAALETTKRSEIALRQSDEFNPRAYSNILMVRISALRALGRSAEARDVLALLYRAEKGAGAIRETAVDPDSGPVPHGTVDMSFLPKIGNMRLREISRFDPDGSDMAGHYHPIPVLNRIMGPFVISAYVTQRPSGDLRDELAAVVKAIQTAKADARIVEPAHRVSVAAKDGTRATGWRVVLANPPLNASTEAMLFKGRGTVVKVRATYPMPSAEALSPEIQAFLRHFDWPPVAPPGMEHRQGEPAFGGPGCSGQRATGRC